MDAGNGSLSGTVRDVHQLLTNHLRQEMDLTVTENGTKGVAFLSGVFPLHLGTS